MSDATLKAEDIIREIKNAGIRFVVALPDRVTAGWNQLLCTTLAGIDKVMGVEGGKAVEKRVRTGRRSGDRVEILEGVVAGDPVVVAPGNLVGGQPVMVAE